MPANVVPHLDFESLIQALSGLERPAGPALQPVVVPSLPFGDHLQRRIADRFGICMGLELLMPQDFIHRAVGPGRDSPWSKRWMVWRVLPHVSEYAGMLGVGDLSPRDRLALAGLLADRLDQYGHFRPEMIRRWALGSGKTASVHEAWQRELWRKLQDATEIPHPALRLTDLQNDAGFCRRLAAQYPRLLVLGTGTLDPLLVDVLGILAGAGSEVNAHIVLPSLGYLGDLRRQGDLPRPEGDPEGIEMAAGHPLLESLGRQAVGSFLLLGRLDENYACWPEPGDQAAAPPGLLARLQSDIRLLRPPQPGSAEPGDASIQVHSCFGARREMEVLRDEIFRAFDEIPGLRPDQVHVITPNLETYAPLVSAVLRQGKTPLPVRLSEIPPSEQDPVLDGILTLLEIAHSGRFEAGDVMELLQKPAVLAALATEDPEALRRWVRDSGFTHGFGEDPGQAGFARSRLVAGRFFDAESPARYPGGGQFVLPVADRLGGGMELRGRFHTWLATLEETMQIWAVAAPASAWADRIRAACQDLLGGVDDDSGLAALPAIAFLSGQGGSEPLDAGAVLDWMQAECADAARRVGVSGKIAFGRFKQLQNLPCRVLAMVGMEDVNFPARNRTPAWDLLREEPRVWDRNPRLDDRQLFLDALLTPSDRLIITASTRNLRTRESEPFSSCVDELLRVVAAMGAGRPVIEQRLQPFAADYFRENTLPRSYDAFHAEVAEKIRTGERSPGSPFWNGKNTLATSGDGREIPIARLAGFWKDPAKAFLKACGIVPAEEDLADEDLNRAPLSLDSLGAWALKNGVVQEILTSAPEVDRLAAESGANRQLPPGRLGESAWRQTLTIAEPLGNAIRTHRGETISLEYPAAGGARVTGELLRTSDGGAWLAYRAGEMKHPRHFLDPWIAALLAGACGSDLPTRIFDEARTETPETMERIPEGQARATLDALVKGFLDGQSRPLGFALATSDELIKKLDGKSGGREAALRAAASKWSAEDRGQGAGEGQGASARLAWRDRNPFENSDEWLELAETISRPLRAWGGIA